MSTTLITVPAAGWYPDPADAGHWRWWDGATWTDHVQMKATEPITAPQAVTPAPEPEPVYPAAPQPHVAPEPPVAPAHFVPEPTASYTEWAAQAAPPAPPLPPAAAPVPPNPAPVEPAPVVASASPNEVPQPGSTVAAPSGPVSMTPETPISDQMYWHSSAAEVIEVPRHHTSTTSSIGPGARGGGNLPRYVVDWNDIGSPQTPGVWLLAFSPLITIAVSAAVGFAMGFAGVTDLDIVRWVLVGLTYVLVWSAAGLDIHALRERGYRPPKIWWMLLLPPLAYLIARGKSVRRESRRAWPPELVYVLNLLLVAGAGFALSAWLLASGLLPTAGCPCP